MFLSRGVLLCQMWMLGKQGRALQAQECTQLLVNTSGNVREESRGKAGRAPLPAGSVPSFALMQS